MIIGDRNGKVDGKLRIAAHTRMWYIICVPFVLSATRLRKEMVSFENCHRFAIFVNDNESGCRLEGQRKEISTRGLLGSCWGKDARILFRLKFSIHQHTGIACDTSS